MEGDLKIVGIERIYAMPDGKSVAFAQKEDHHTAMEPPAKIQRLELYMAPTPYCCNWVRAHFGPLAEANETTALRDDPFMPSVEPTSASEKDIVRRHCVPV